MTLIYFKLGSLPEYTEETLDFHLGNNYPDAGVLDYTNLNPNILVANNAGEIIQINEQEYYSIINGQAVANGTQVVNAGDLITLTNYLNVCPLDNDVFFVLKAGKWFKISWLRMKQCISTGVRTDFLFRVGDETFVDGLTIPNDGDTTFQNDKIKNIDITIKANGIEIYPQSVYKVDQLPNVDYYTHNKVDGIITRPAKFKDEEIIHITQN